MSTIDRRKKMMQGMILGALLGVGLSFGSASRAQDKDKDTVEVGKKSDSPSVSGADANADHKFLMMAAQGNLAEIQMAQLAKQKSQNNQIQNYAQRLIEDHTTANNQVMQIVHEEGA